MQIQISWLLLHCLQRQSISRFSRTRVNNIHFCEQATVSSLPKKKKILWPWNNENDQYFTLTGYVSIINANDAFQGHLSDQGKQELFPYFPRTLFCIRKASYFLYKLFEHSWEQDYLFQHDSCWWVLLTKQHQWVTTWIMSYIHYSKKSVQSHFTLTASFMR